MSKKEFNIIAATLILHLCQVYSYYVMLDNGCLSFKTNICMLTSQLDIQSTVEDAIQSDQYKICLKSPKSIQSVCNDTNDYQVIIVYNTLSIRFHFDLNRGKWEINKIVMSTNTRLKTAEKNINKTLRYLNEDPGVRVSSEFSIFTCEADLTFSLLRDPKTIRKSREKVTLLLQRLRIDIHNYGILHEGRIHFKHEEQCDQMDTSTDVSNILTVCALFAVLIIAVVATSYDMIKERRSD